MTEANAHPHADERGRVHVVLNGIVENHLDVRAGLAERGIECSSETDAEVVAHLVALHGQDGDLVRAVARTREELEGQWAFVALGADEPGKLVATRRGAPLVVGAADGERFVASSQHAFAHVADSMQVLEDDEIVVVEADDASFLTPSLARVERPSQKLDTDGASTGKDGYRTYMLKEIHEQPAAIARTVLAATTENGVDLSALGVSPERLAALSRLTIVGCGTSYHAGLSGRTAIEEWTGLPVDVAIASEHRDRPTMLGAGDLVVGMTQSGETADTLAALHAARAQGATVLAITNDPASEAARIADGVLQTGAGVEVSVAATKTFTAQVVATYLLGLGIAQARGSLTPERIAELAQELRALPRRVETLLSRTEDEVARAAIPVRDKGFFMFLGRHAGLPIALEGALKLKEVAYVPTDAYAAGEMKHGPIALLEEGTPVVCVATDSATLERTLSNVAEVRARGARVIAIATEGSDHVAEHVDDVLWVPRTDWLLQSCLAVVPLQLLAHEIAEHRGLDVDRPRNLAKTVTVL